MAAEEPKAVQPKMYLRLLQETLRDWRLDNVPLMAAGLSFYAILAVAPLLFLAMSIASRIYPDEAQAQITLQITRFIGARVAVAVSSMLSEAGRQSGSTLAIVGSVGALFLATSGAFAQLMNALDVIWKVRPSGDRGLLGTVLDRVVAFSMVLVMFVVTSSSFVVTTVLARANRVVPFQSSLGPILNIVLSLALSTLMFAAIFKILPRVRLTWRDVWIGAFVTATLFVIGKEAIGVYLGLSNVTSAYGATGSIIVLLIFIYGAAQILLLGAEFTKHYARRLGSRPPIDVHALRYRIVTELDQDA